MARLLKLFAIALTAAFVGGIAQAAEPPVYTGTLSNTALGGYDAVSFFTPGAPVEGARDFETTYNGATWRFSSAENLARFEADPVAYAPQYGGYCAWAIAQGYTAKGDPRYATVVAGKLYLNFNADILARWQEDIPGFIATADANWPQVLNQ